MRPFRLPIALVALLAVAALVALPAGASAQNPIAPGQDGQTGPPLPTLPTPGVEKIPGGGLVKVKVTQKRKGKRTTRRSTRVAVGIADQKWQTFTSPLFQSLGLRYARRSVAWDTMQYDWQIEDVDLWLRSARALGIRPLLTFARSRIDAKRHHLPTRSEIRTAFSAFRARWPWVTEYVATNESNHGGEPTFKRPGTAAGYYKDMRKICPTCKIVAATLLEQNNMVPWVKKFIRAAGHQPKYWALHNYITVNRFQTGATRKLLRAVRGQIWLTETGGLVKRRTPDRPGKVKLREGTKHAAAVTKFLFTRVLPLSTRIKRAYLYHWATATPRDTWDSALVSFDGRPRPSLSIVEQALRGTLRR